MNQNNYIPLTGLALRAGRLIMGADAVVSAIQENKVKLILFAADISAHTRSAIVSAAENTGCLLTDMPCGKRELGGALGRAAVSVAALTDIGFANALMERLSMENPERYAGTAMVLKRRFQRMKERRMSQAHRQKSPRNGTADKQEPLQKDKKKPPQKGKPYQQKFAQSDRPYQKKSPQGGKVCKPGKRENSCHKPGAADSVRRHNRPARTATGPPRKHSGESGGGIKRVPSRGETYQAGNHPRNRRENHNRRNKH